MPKTDKIDESEICMTPDCGKKGEWKGLCRSCYGQALHLIKDEKTTWDELAEMGLAAYPSRPFMLAFARKKRDIEEANQSTTPNHQEPAP